MRKPSLGELLVAHLRVGAALHVLLVGDVLEVELGQLGRLPVARALDRRALVVGPGEAGLEDDLARLAAVVVAGRAVGLDDRRRLLGVAERPQAVAEARRDLRRLRPERRDVELRARLRARPQARVLELEPAGVHRHRLAVPQARDRLQARLQAAALLLVGRPVHAQRRLVDRLAGADAEEHAPG